MDLSIYRLRTRDILTLCVVSLLLLGVIMVQSASASVTGQDTSQWTAKGIKHALFALVSLITFLGIGAIDYGVLDRKPHHWWQSSIAWILIVAGIANLIVLIPHIGVAVNGARRWLPLGPIQVQPSEIAKWAVVLYLAWWLTYRPMDLDRFFSGFLPTIVPIGVLCLLVVIQDFGTATLIAATALVMLIAGRARWWHLFLVVPLVFAAGLWFVMHKEYRWKRIIAFENPYAAPQKEGYHMIQSLLSFSTGGVTGRGLGNGIQKLGYLPEDTTDFIFAVICEELGLFGAMLTIALYLGILYCAWQSLKEHRDGFGKMLAFGIGIMVSLQAVINIAVATVSVPTKGLSLPLVSAGGSGLVITCAALGLLRSVCRFQPQSEVVGEPDSSEASPLPPFSRRRSPFMADSAMRRFTT